MNFRCQGWSFMVLLLGIFCAAAEPASRFVVVRKIEVGRVPSAFPVRFCLMTSGKRQYVAYYD